MICVCGLKLTHYLKKKKLEYSLLFFDYNITVRRTLEDTLCVLVCFFNNSLCKKKTLCNLDKYQTRLLYY